MTVTSYYKYSKKELTGRVGDGETAKLELLDDKFEGILTIEAAGVPVSAVATKKNKLPIQNREEFNYLTLDV